MDFKFETDISLTNGNLLLRPMELADIGALLPVALEEPKLLQFSPKQIYTEELLTTYVKQALAMRKEGDRYTFTIIDQTTNRAIGSTAFLNISNTDDRLEIGATWIAKPLQGKGFNAQCKYLLLEYIFDYLLAHRVEFKADERNIQSRKALEKIGAKFEGTLREHTLMYDGFRRNSCCYSILISEWMHIKNTLSYGN